MPTFRFVSVLAVLATALASAQSNPAPFVNQPLVPMSTTPGGSGFSLTVNGTGFISGSTVNWNGTPLPTTFVKASQLTATVTAADIAMAQTAWITVVNPAPGGGKSNVAFFQVTNPSAPPAFVNTSYNLPGAFGSAISADFNGDGKMDVAVSVSESATADAMLIYIGNGDGTLKSPVSYPLPQESYGFGVLAGDLNGDGKLDLVAGHSLFLGNGDGTFRSAIDLGIYLLTAGQVYAIGDFNGDGKLDLAGSTVFFSGSPVFVALGNGDGTFQPVTTIGSGCGDPLQMSAADFNNDGKLDLIFRGGVCVFLGNGDGTFQAPTGPFSGSTGYAGSPMTIADINGDGKQDIFFGGGQFALEGKGDGTFQAGSTPSPDCVLGSVAGDFNGDGHIDIAGNCLLLGNGDGTFNADTNTGLVPEDQAVAAGDFNGDGRLDLVTVCATCTGDQLSIFVQATPDFSVSAVSTSQTIMRGQTANYSLTVAPVNNFSQSVTFTCSGAPSGTTCTVTPTSVTLDGTKNSSVAVSISSTAMAGLLPLEPANQTHSAAFAIWTILGPAGLIVFLPIASEQHHGRRRVSRLGLLSLVCVGVAMFGCGGNSSNGTQPGTYTLTVTGTNSSGSTSLTHSVSLTLTVQ